jgi:hypothetical protein
MKRYAALAFLATLFLATTAMAAAPDRHTGDTPQARRATRALNLLEAKGWAAGLEDKSFGAFQSFTEQGNDFAATVVQHGRRFVLIVDPETGQVKRQD